MVLPSCLLGINLVKGRKPVMIHKDKRYSGDAHLPQLTPDLIDDFVTWLTSQGYNLYSFQLSDVAYRKKLFAQFWKQLPPDKKQFKINFPD